MFHPELTDSGDIGLSQALQGNRNTSVVDLGPKFIYQTKNQWDFAQAFS